MSTDSTFTVHTGDSLYYFEHGRSYQQSYVRQVFRERLKRCPACSHPYELFPGLVLKDDNGDLWKVKLRATLMPVKPEEENEEIPTTTRP
jgi:hypothetical protein